MKGSSKDLKFTTNKYREEESDDRAHAQISPTEHEGSKLMKMPGVQARSFLAHDSPLLGRSKGKEGQRSKYSI